MKGCGRTAKIEVGEYFLYKFRQHPFGNRVETI